MTLSQLMLIQANVWFLAFCVVMPYLGKTATGIAQFSSLFAGPVLLAWAFFAFVATGELPADETFSFRCFYVGAAVVTAFSLLIVWKPWKARD